MTGKKFEVTLSDPTPAKLEKFLVRSVDAEGFVLAEEEIDAAELRPFEGDVENGKGCIEIATGLKMKLQTGHDHFEWERA